MNDPNGMFYDEANGVWHLYYQHNPFGTTWGPVHWGHATSTDLLTWEEHPIVLYPDSIGTIFSGFAIGLERITACFLGIANVKECSMFPRDINRVAP